MKITYIDNLTENSAAKYLVAYLRDNTSNRFIMAKKIFAMLQTAYDNTDKKHTAQVKFQKMQMIINFSSF